MAAQKKSGKRGRTSSKSPSEFAPNVFVGNWEDAQRFEGTRFCVLDDAPDDMPPATHIRIYDAKSDRADPKGLDRLAEAMRSAHSKGQPVLVFCHQGVYRSPLGATWYLHRNEGLPLDQAAQRVVAARPKAKAASTWVGNYSDLLRA